MWCSAWNFYFWTSGLWGDFNCIIINALVYPFLGEINIWSGVKNTAEGRGSATLIENKSLRGRLGYLLNTRVHHAQVHDAINESKGESIDFHEKYIAEEILEEAKKELKRSTVPGAVKTLSQ